MLMIYLVSVSIIWSFSFGFIKYGLDGMDPFVVGFIRLFLAFLFFLPAFKPSPGAFKAAPRLLVIGGIQFGLMYMFYLLSYQFLQAHEIAIFTVLTPLYVALLDAVIEKRWITRYLLSALGACFGALMIRGFPANPEGFVRGFMLVQCSNICFAAGQLLYRRVAARFELGRDHSAFCICYAGAVLVAGFFMLLLGPKSIQPPTSGEWLILLYLGLIPSGIGFFLWNLGARRVNAGVLSAMNNLKVPLAAAVSCLFFGESLKSLSFWPGACLILISLWVSRDMLLGGSINRNSKKI
ncbi:MAG: EamA family transporter [Candidatus Omnitrophica bacterium]|nr:EamA family transporter [Candidatus Omnitrophota bacterium]